ncbi:NAD(P)H dehydrogenase (quinone) [Crossiella equi]|uniref:NAD(P)H dehydrogenase (Quinone) n=1 Tax=Crossiella equi TaxID=130796 RepID=A0ABS5ANP3_9PSEU|nr:SDR family oxidoreductase [Crossiella equi]MBP2478186.1 NAD(P)H dehydrogenase (quinone) [Crossiella equi]
MSIVVTGATGQLGRLVVKHLLARVPAEQVVGSVRNPANGADLGIALREGDFDRPETLAAAFAGADKLLIISTDGDTGTRLRQHAAAVQAAQAAGVRHIHYTSLTNATDAKIALADVHRPTEEAIRATGLPFTILRDNWYLENDHGTILGAAASGVLATSSRGGRFAPATREDFARAIAAVLATDGHENTVYELGAPVSYGYADFARVISEVSGKEVRYVEVTPAEATAGLRGAGLPEPLVELIVDYYDGLGRGELDRPDGALERLSGQPVTSLRDYVASVLIG